MNKFLLFGLCCVVLLARAGAAPAFSKHRTHAPVSPARILQSDTARSLSKSIVPRIPSDKKDKNIDRALYVAGAYADSYQTRDVKWVQGFCSARLLADPVFNQTLADTFKHTSEISLKKVVVGRLFSTEDMVLVHEDAEWKQTDAKNGVSSTFHAIRILRLVKEELGWAVDDDKIATDDISDVARELTANHLGNAESIAVDDNLDRDALITSIIAQTQTQYVQKYDHYRAVKALGWALAFAKQSIGKIKGADQALATTLSWLASEEVSAGNYAAAVNDKPTSQFYYQAAVKDYQSYFALVEKNTILSTPAIMTYAHESLGVAFQGLGQYDQALTYRWMALHEGNAQRNGAMESEALSGIGTLLAIEGNRSDELKFYKDYIQQQRVANDKIALAGALYSLGVFHREGGSYAQALPNFVEVKRLEEDLGDDNGAADAWMSIGGLYDYQVDFSDAQNSYKQAQIIYERTHNDAGVADVWRCVSHVDYEQGQFTKSLEDAFNGLKIAEQKNNLAEIVRLYHCIGSTLQSQGDYRQAANYIQACAHNAAILNDSIFENAATVSLASLFVSQGDYDQALEQMTNCNAVSERVSDPNELRSNLRTMANIWDKKGDYTQALRYIQQAIELSRSLGPSWESAAIYEAQGDILSNQGYYDKAIEAYTKALDTARIANAWPIVAGTQVAIGETYFREEKFAAALQQYQEGLKLIEASDLVYLSNCYADIGYAYFRLNQYDNAAQACRTAIRYTETLRSQIAGGAREQQLFFQTQLNPYQTLMLILLAQHRDQEAFACLEQSRARVIRDSFGSQPDMTAYTSEELAQTHFLTTSLVSLNKQVLVLKRGMPDSPALAPLEATQGRMRLEYDVWQAILYNRHVQPDPPSLNHTVTCMDAFQMLPNAGTAFLEYTVLDNMTYLFVLTKQGMHSRCEVYRINCNASQLKALVDQFRNGVAARDDSTAFHPEARRLYEMLLGGPVKAQLKGIDTLCIVPDGPLWNLPFQALQPADEQYVIDNQTIFFTPSLTALRDMRLKDGPTYHDKAPLMLAVGNPALAKKSKYNESKPASGMSSATSSHPEVMNDLFLPLPQAEAQVKDIAALYGSMYCKVLVGHDANEEHVKSEMEKYQMLQFATHGVANEINPMYSYLLLSQANDGEVEDGMLFAADVMKMHLHARLVVLAACDTARGQVSPGEGLVGLTWAFLHAGCPRVVASQWQIDAGPTTMLMVDFHSNLLATVHSDADGAVITKALRNAALKLRKTELYRHPYYWAPFVLTGDGFPQVPMEKPIQETKI